MPDQLRRLRARIEADVARLRMGGEGIATILDHLAAGAAMIDDYLAEIGPNDRPSQSAPGSIIIRPQTRPTTGKGRHGKTAAALFLFAIL